MWEVRVFMGADARGWPTQMSRTVHGGKRDDQRTIVRARAVEPPLLFDHRDGAREPMLWIADAVTWAVGAGGRWLQRADPILETVVELRP